MKRFIVRLLVFLSPLFILVGMYFYTDPFKMVYHSNDAKLWAGNLTVNGNVTANRDCRSTDDFLDNYKNHKYASFILGNSKSLMFLKKEWAKHILDTGIFHWDASGETLYGVERKLNYLDKEKMDIKNVLVVIDPWSLIKVANRKGHLYVAHYKVTEQNYFAFEFECMQDFFDPEFLQKWAKDMLSVNSKKTEKTNIDKFDNIYCDTFTYDKISNELTYYSFDKMLSENEEKYYQVRIKNKIFYGRDTIVHYHKPYINSAQKVLLNNMNRIFKDHKTNFKIVFSPAYDQLKLDTTDLKYLQGLFGKDHVYDFSGINDLNKDMHNFYDVHYKAFVANRMMDIIYSPFADDSMNKIFNK